MERVLAWILLAVAAATSARAEDAPRADDDAAEPPQVVELELEGARSTFNSGARALVRVAGKDVEVALRALPRRQFDKSRVRFEYPASMHFEHDLLPDAVTGGTTTLWTLEGRTSVVTLYRYPLAAGTPEQMLSKLTDIAIPFLYGKENVLAKGRQELRYGRPLPGARITVRQDGVETVLLATAFAVGPHVFWLLACDKEPGPGGKPSAEFAEITGLFERTFAFPGTAADPVGTGVAAAPVPEVVEARSNARFWLALACALASVATVVLAARLGSRAPPEARGALGAPHGSVRAVIAVLVVGAALARTGLDLADPASPLREARVWMAALVAVAALAAPGTRARGPRAGLELVLAATGALAIGWIGYRWGVGGRPPTNEPSLAPLLFLSVYWLARMEAAVLWRLGGPARFPRYLAAQATSCLVAAAVLVALLLGEPSFPALAERGIPLGLIELALLAAPAYYAGVR